MPNVFLNHSSKDKQIVLKTQTYLYSCFINSWVDKDIKPGNNIWDEINSNIQNGRYFMPFISKNYCNSDACMDELANAHARYIKGELKIIPVLLIEPNELDLTSFTDDKSKLLNLIIENLKYVEFDIYNKEPGLKNIAEAVWSHECIKFNPIETLDIGSKKLQIIRFQTTTNELPSNYLEEFDFDIESFISKDINDNKLINPNIPVAFNGAAPNWLITFFTIPFKNQRTVFLFNNRSGDYVCVYSLDKDNMLGKTIKV